MMPMKIKEQPVPQFRHSYEGGVDKTALGRPFGLPPKMIPNQSILRSKGEDRGLNTKIIANKEDKSSWTSSTDEELVLLLIQFIDVMSPTKLEFSEEFMELLTEFNNGILITIIYGYGILYPIFKDRIFELAYNTEYEEIIIYIHTSLEVKVAYKMLDLFYEKWFDKYGKSPVFRLAFRFGQG